MTPVEPVMRRSIAARSPRDEERLANALTRLAKEDPSLKIKCDSETGETLLYGTSEAHLESVVGRIAADFAVEVEAGPPQVAYKETVRSAVTAEGKFIRQSGGRSQYAHCIIKIEPQPMGKGFQFVSEVRQGHIPAEYVPAVERGVREALDGGALAGYPIIDIKVTLLGGSFHEADSNEMAFKIAGAMALRSGCKKANPTILEPVMTCEVLTLEANMGDVIGDLNSRRAQIQDMGDSGRLKFVLCRVPLAEMFGYARVLHSISRGLASFTMEPSHYAEVPYETYRASIDPHGPDEPPTASAGRPVKPIRPKPGLSGGSRRAFPPKED